MELTPVTQASLEKGAKILLDGGLVAFPTETVYGLGADAFNPVALSKIFEVKGRPHFDPLIIHIANLETLEKTADLSKLNDDTKDKLFILAKNLWPGPLSIILPKNEKIPGIATAGLPAVAIRFPDNTAALKLISLSSGAVAAPSANPFGSLSPTRAEHVRDKLGSKIDMILDGGSSRIGVESTVLDLTGKEIKILRPGGTPKEAIEKLIGTVLSYKENDNSSTPSSPGQLKSHYAPGKALSVFSKEEIIKKPYKAGVSFLFFDDCTKDAWQDLQKPPAASVFKVLSKSGQMLEAASRLFEILHEFDNDANISCIFAQTAPQQGLGEAINDRLLRGSQK
ncbi:MAG: L-threonylcarbamoyladenylate synthase [Treponema sp.]|nr:L-threonylcarbamoyladenylate synthase [Treponema sp.]MCL2252466.1 L-threonylcarbamoyladenylate synthase [Treponema sp.]